MRQHASNRLLHLSRTDNQLAQISNQDRLHSIFSTICPGGFSRFGMTSQFKNVGLWGRLCEASVAEPALTIARLALVQGVATVIVSGLQVIGVSPVEEL